MELTNLTPHEITIKHEKKSIILPKGKFFARIEFEYEEEEHPVQVLVKNKTVMHPSPMKGYKLGLPQPKDNHYYVVSNVVAQYNKHRKDLVFPNRTHQDNEGNKFCNFLVRWKQ